MTIEEIRKGAPSGATHYSKICGVITYFTIIGNKVFYNEKPWNHANVMSFKSLKSGE